MGKKKKKKKKDLFMEYIDGVMDEYENAKSSRPVHRDKQTKENRYTINAWTRSR